jgi:RNase H-fold protein (predicted Holliday junction resolvase)
MGENNGRKPEQLFEKTPSESLVEFIEELEKENSSLLVSGEMLRARLTDLEVALFEERLKTAEARRWARHFKRLWRGLRQ